jgi:putative SOS response-associated peptidase YedK
MEVVASIFEVESAPELVPRYNISPTSALPVVVKRAGGQREVRFMRWGLVPSWAQDPSIGQRMINARSETAEEKPSFRTALRRRRCLIPADGFFEWRQEGAVKQPYFVEMVDGRPFGFGGLWESWEGAEGAFESCTILTTPANATVAPLHDRMPVIVPPHAYGLWLDPELVDVRAIEPFLAPFVDRPMHFFAVDRRVGNPRFDEPTATRPIGPTSLF